MTKTTRTRVSEGRVLTNGDIAFDVSLPFRGKFKVEQAAAPRFKRGGKYAGGDYVRKSHRARPR